VDWKAGTVIAQTDPEVAKKLHLRPIGENIVVVPVRQDEERESNGVILPQSADNAETEYIVVGLGDGRRDPISDDLARRLAHRAAHVADVMWGDEDFDGPDRECAIDALIAALRDESAKPYAFEVAVGDRVLICPWLVSTVTLEDVEYSVCSERDVLGRFEDG
jgi:co-chaperonin GroES (HSP10)